MQTTGKPEAVLEPPDIDIKAETEASLESVLHFSGHLQSTTIQQEDCDDRQPGEQFSVHQSTTNPLALSSSNALINPTSFVLSRWLNSIQDDPNRGIIARACGYILQHQPTDGGETSSQTGPTSLNSAHGSKTNKRPQKRKASDFDNDNDNSRALTSITKSPSTKNERKTKFACHFYKRNQRAYATCGRSGYGTISHLADHLRKEHSLKEHSCHACWLPFRNAEELTAHNNNTRENVCLPTEGTPMNTLRITKIRTGDYDKWFWIWDQLFRNPRIERARSPYWEDFDYDGQLFSTQRQFMLDELTLIPSLSSTNIEFVMDSLARFQEIWENNPPEPHIPEPIPTPAVTQGSADNGQPILDTSLSSEIEDSTIPSRSVFNPPVASRDDSSLRPGEMTDDTLLNTIVQEPLNIAIGSPTEFSALEEIQSVSLAGIPDAMILPEENDPFFSSYYYDAYPDDSNDLNLLCLPECDSTSSMTTEVRQSSDLKP
ncbi:hypothetical protein F4819DRAFT_466947 [Hypoxylon fuscum]|nr:hypothetical protein F4819DRAFT_466947 [Hypoxylon fuscum]